MVLNRYCPECRRTRAFVEREADYLCPICRQTLDKATKGRTEAVPVRRVWEPETLRGAAPATCG